MRTHRIALSFALGLALAIGCSSSTSSRSRALKEDDEHRAVVHQDFDSKESVLVDFAMDGKLVTNTADLAAVRTLIEAQFLYSVGALNTDRSVGRLERLDLSAIVVTPQAEGPASFLVTYHAKVPVAWGAPTPAPTTYALTLPARVGQDDQNAFASKYGTTCVDPAAGVVEAGRMFLYYRPLRPGCTLDSADVVTLQATVSASTENTTGKYPEYHLIWEDGALDIVAMFSRAAYVPNPPADTGVDAFTDFIAKTDAYLTARQPDATKRTTVQSTATTTTLSATLPDGRVVHVDAALVGPHMSQEGPELDAWYNALTPHADMIIYSGHAGLGANVRTLMTKGTFAPRKYVLWVVNGCDTFAYVDRTLIDRRAVVNPDDAAGTKYMDTVATVMGGYFTTASATTQTFFDALIRARDAGAVPKTYREIFAEINSSQVTVVTGEEDNAFVPSMFAPPTPTPTPAPASSSPTATTDAGNSSSSSPPPPPPEANPEPATNTDGERSSTPGAPTASGETTPLPSSTGGSDDGGGSCSVARGQRARSSMAMAMLFAMFTASLLRRRQRQRSTD